jgi:hypothetical protein
MHVPIRTFTGAFAPESLFIWLAAVAFLAGGAINATGHRKIRAGFERLGFPGWWCWVTAALEVATALLLLWPGTRYVGAALGACIMFAAIAAIVRARAYRELAPPLLFLSFLAVASFGVHA